MKTSAVIFGLISAALITSPISANDYLYQSADTSTSSKPTEKTEPKPSPPSIPYIKFVPNEPEDTSSSTNITTNYSNSCVGWANSIVDRLDEVSEYDNAPQTQSEAVHVLNPICHDAFELLKKAKARGCGAETINSLENSINEINGALSLYFEGNQSFACREGN